MSALPPQLIVSSLQSTLQQHQVLQNRSVADRRQTDTSAAIVRAGQQHETQIDNAEADSQIHSDSSGAGGQGRSFHEEPQQDIPGSSEPAANGPDIDADGQTHLDITA